MSMLKKRRKTSNEYSDNYKSGRSKDITMKKSFVGPSIFVIALILVTGCFSQPPHVPGPHTAPERGFLMGGLPIPYEGQSFEEAYREAAPYCEFVPVWGKPTPFYELADDLSGTWGKTFVNTYIRENGMIPLIHLSFIDAGVTLKVPPGMEATLADTEWRSLYTQSVLDVVHISNPEYLSLGNEVNKWYEKYGIDEHSPNGFHHYVTLYEEIYDAVKEISPETTVFCTFAREIVSENREANLDVLKLFDPEKMDILVFTSYPYALKGINTPSDIPDDYYSKAFVYMPGKPVGFSEVAWPSLDPFGGEQGQADFLRDICGRLTIHQDINLYFVGWPWFSDLNDNDFVGLIKRDGTEKIGYTVWKTLFTG